MIAFLTQVNLNLSPPSFQFNAIPYYSYCASRALSEIVMNFVGVFLWIAVGAVALHYWGGYQGEHQFQFVFAEKQVRNK